MYEYEIQKVNLRSRPVELLNEFTKKGFRVVHVIHENADMVCLLEREVEKVVKKAVKKVEKEDEAPITEE
jgi:phosphoribosylformimino-5-aminoimidazole carboxamide ribonucleotide (ProFAR) isomerase